MVAPPPQRHVESDQFEAELTKDEPVLEKLGSGSEWRWFRYPFLDEGKDEASASPEGGCWQSTNIAWPT